MKWIHFIFICHWHIFCVENILQFQYCFWLFTDVDYFFMCKMFLSFSTDVYVIFCYWNILMKCTHFICICHLLMLTYFCVKNVPEFQYCFWLFTDVDYFSCAKCSYHSRLMFVWFSCTETYWWSGHTSFSYVIDIFFVWKIFYNFNIAFDYLLMLTIFHVKMFLSFSTDVCVIFLYWNILMKCTHFIFICHILLLIIYWCWLFFHVQIVLIILNWCLCDFLVLKHINEVDALHLHLSFTDVDMFQYCFWLFTDVDYFFMCKMFLSFSTDVYVIFCYWNISMKCTHFICICHLLMLTYFLCGKYSTISILLLIIYWCWLFFHVQNVLIILNWCLWDFLLLKHIDEVHALHLHLSFTDVDIFFVWKIFYNFNTAFDYLLMLTIFSCAKCSYHSRLMFMWFSVTETYWWSARISSAFVIYWCWHIFVSKMFQNFNIAFGYLLMLTIFHVKMFLSFSTDVCVIFLYWNILMKWTHFIFICHWHIFCVENILQFQYCFWLFTDVDYFSCENVLIILNWCLCDFLVLKHINEVYTLHLHLSYTAFDYLLMLTIFSCANCSYHSQLMFMWFSGTETYQWSGCTSSSFVIYWCWHVSILLLIIYWCWLFFQCKMFLSFSTDVYVIFCYWNISMKCTHFICICHLLMLTYFLCGKYSTISILLLIIYWCWLFFHVQNVLIILNWCLWDFLLLKHIDEVHALHLHLSFTDVDIFFVWKIFYNFNTALIIYWCWLFFHVQNVLIILNWCLCDFLLLKYIDEVDTLHLHLSLTYFLCGKYSTISILLLIIYWYWLFFHVQNVLIILDWCLCDFLLLKHINEGHTFHLHLSFTDVDIIFVWKILQNFNIAFDYLLMLTIFHVQNVLIILDWCLCDFLVLKHIDEVDILHFHMSLTYFLCGKYSTISILLLIIYWCWLFFMWKCSYHSQLMFMWFSCTETY